MSVRVRRASYRRTLVVVMVLAILAVTGPTAAIAQEASPAPTNSTDPAPAPPAEPQVTGNPQPEPQPEPGKPAQSSELPETSDTPTPATSGDPAPASATAASEPTEAVPSSPPEVTAHSVPEPSNSTSVINVKVRGDRALASGQTPQDLAGVQLRLYRDNNGSVGSALDLTDNPWATCTSDAAGDCSFVVPDTGNRGENRNERYWVRWETAPSGWFALTALRTGEGGSNTTQYQFRTPQMQSNNTYTSGAQFMSDPNGNNGNDSTGMWQQSRNNPLVPEVCGLRVGLVLDLSNSLSDSEFRDLKEAGNAFVDSLEGTPSTVAVYTFASTAPAKGSKNTTLRPTSVATPEGAQSVRDKIDGLVRPGGDAGGTNWDRGLFQVAQAQDQLDSILFVTDGNPTFYGQSSTSASGAQGPGNTTTFVEVENGIFSANAVKAKNTKIIGVGILGTTSSSAAANLQAVSGTELNRDYYLVDDFAELGDNLRALALSACKATVSVVKKVVPAGGSIDDAAPQAGWVFAAESSAAISPASASTPESGAVNFSVDLGVATSAAVTVTETPQAGYGLLPQDGKNAECTRLDTGELVEVTDAGPFGFTVDSLLTSGISCQVTNKAVEIPLIELTKSADRTSLDAAGQKVTYTFAATNTGNVPLSDVTVADPLPGLSALVCDRQAPVQLELGETVNCTATYDVTQSDMDAGLLENTATASGRPPSGPRVSDTAGQTLPVTTAPQIALLKSADVASVGRAGDIITYKYELSNSGNVTLSGVTLADPMPDLSALDCTTDLPATLLPTETDTCTATYTTTQADIDGGAIANTATATGRPPAGLPVSATDDVTVPATAAPALTLAKSALTRSTKPGQDITYRFTATNSGNVTLTGVQVTDPLPGLSTLSCDIAGAVTLAPEDQLTCTATYTVALDDANAGMVANTATATGSAPDGSAAQATDSETVPVAQLATIDLVKTSDTATVASPGQVITYGFRATNTGNVTLTSISISDPLPGLSAMNCGPDAPTTLDPGASLNCTANYTTTRDDIDTGFVTNTATAGGTTESGIPVTDTDTQTVTALQSAAIALTKTADTTSVSEVGDSIAYTLAAENLGNVTLNNVTISDPLLGLGALACDETAPVTLQPNQTLTCTASYTVTQADLDAGRVQNLATASGNPPSGSPVSDTADLLVSAAQDAAIGLVKTADSPNVNAAGQVITYTFTASNTGNVTLPNATITDPMPGLSPLSCAPVQPAPLAPGQTLICTATYTVLQSDIDAGSIANQATATAQPTNGGQVSGTDAENVSAVQTASLSLVKSADHAEVRDDAVGEIVTYTYLATNTGNITLHDVAIDDPHQGLSPLACAPDTPTEVLDPGGTITCIATYAITQADLDAGLITNTATASGTAANQAAVTVEDSIVVNVVGRAALDLTKTADVDFVANTDDNVEYTFIAKNTGALTLEGVSIADDMSGLSELSCNEPMPATLPTGASLTCTATYAVAQADIDTGSVVNTATASGTTALGSPVSATDTESVPAAQNASVELTKIPDVPTVAKAGDPINYTFVATNDGNVTVSGVSITDPMEGLSTLDCTPPTPTTLAPGEAATCTATYLATQADIDAGLISNLATMLATSPSGQAMTETAAASVSAVQSAAIDLVKTSDRADIGVDSRGETIGYTFVATNIGNVALSGVTITDPLPGLSDLTCGAEQGATLQPGGNLTCSASYVVTQADVNSGIVTNTATATGLPPSGSPVTDAARVTVRLAQNAAVLLTKTADVPSVEQPGDPITYNFLATNNGNVTLSDVTITDPLPGLGALACTRAPGTTLEPGESVSCTASYTTTLADLDAGAVANTATVLATTPSGSHVTNSAAATVTASQVAAIRLDKLADKSQVRQLGEVITYTMVATNTGNVSLSQVTVTDPLTGLSTLDCAPGIPAPLAPGESVSCVATYAVTQADLDAGMITNTATASGTPPSGQQITTTDGVTVGVAIFPVIRLKKNADVTTVAKAGDPIEYTFEVTNIGNITLDEVSITDPMAGLSALDCAPTLPATLAPDASATCTAVHVATQAEIDAGLISNVGTASGKPPIGAPVSDTDRALVLASSAPALAVTKTADVGSVDTAGTPVGYTIVATNTGNVTLSNVAVEDPLLGAGSLTCTPVAPAVLQPEQSLTCTGEHAATQAEVDAGQIANTATAAGSAPDGSAVTASGDALVTAPANPTVTVVKSADTSSVDSVGDIITYTVTATNTGNVSLHEVAIDDPLPGLLPPTCTPEQPASLAPGETLTCISEYPVTQADLDAGQVFNRASVSAAPPSGPPIGADDDTTVPSLPAPAIDLVKTADQASVNAAGDVITYRFLVTNVGNVTLHDVGVTDALRGLSPLTCDQPGDRIMPGEAILCDATYPVTQEDIDTGVVLNAAVATGQPPIGDPVSDTDSQSVPVVQSDGLTLTKTADVSAVAAVGDPVTYTFVATNSGNVTLRDVAVSDPMAGLTPLTCDPDQPAELTPGAMLTCTATYATTQSDLDAGVIANTATGTAVPVTGGSITTTAEASVPATPIPSMSVSKTSDVTTVALPGDVVTYTIEATNTGNVTLSDVTVTDSLPGLSAVSCDQNAPFALAPGQVLGCTATYAVSQVDLNAGLVSNLATVSGTPPVGDPVGGTDESSVVATQTPRIDLVKAATPSVASNPGELIDYRFTATNTGNVTLTDVVLDDPMPGLSAIACDLGQSAVLQPNQVLTCTAQHMVTQIDFDSGLITNTATASGAPPTGDRVLSTASTTVTAPQVVAIDVLKTAQPTSVSTVGEVINYTINATNTGNVTLADVVIDDPMDGLSGLTCVPVQPAPLAPGESLNCAASYTVTQQDLDSGVITNSATATGTEPGGATVTDFDPESVVAAQVASIGITKTADPTTVPAAGDTITYTLVATNTGTVTLTDVAIVDALPGLSELSCTTSGSVALSPGQSLSCTATYVATQSDINSGSIANTATATGTQPAGGSVTDSDSDTVTAAQSPGLTIDKAAAHAVAIDDVGDLITYTMTAANTGNVTLTEVEITDPLTGLSPIQCVPGTPADLDPGQMITCSGEYHLKQDDLDNGSLSNTATVTGTAPSGATITAQDSETIPVSGAPAMSLTKSAQPATVDAVGQIITYTFEALNVGALTLVGTTIDDPMIGLSALTCDQGAVLPPGQALTCTATYAVTQADLDTGVISNTASAAADTIGGLPLTDTDSETVNAAVISAIDLTKTPDVALVNTPGDTIGYTLIATNTGTVTLSDVMIADLLPGLSPLACVTTTPAILAPGTSLTCTTSLTVTQANLDAGMVANTATATGTPPNGAVATDTAPATVPAAQAASITLDKTAGGVQPSDSAGDAIEYTLIATNNGNVTLTGVTISDPMPGLSGLSCSTTQPTILAPGASLTCTADYTVTQADVDAGQIANTGSTSGTPPGGNVVTAEDPEVVPVTQTVAIDLVKSASPSSLAAAGAEIAYAFTATNAGNVTLTDVAISDPLPDLTALACDTPAPVSLAPGGVLSCTATYTSTQADINAGVIANTATATGLPPTGPAATDDDSETVTASQGPAIELLKSADATSVAAAGDPLRYTFAATNTGNVTLTGVEITDPLAGLSALTCGAGAPVLAPGQTLTCTATYLATQADIDAGGIANSAAVIGTPPSGPPATDTASISVPAIPDAALALAKEADRTSVALSGDAINYTFIATNTGNVTLTGVTITDPMPGLSALDCAPVDLGLAPSQSLSCTATYSATQADIDSGAIPNTATATAAPPTGGTIEASANLLVPAAAAPAIGIVKSADTTAIPAAGTLINYTFVTTNTGNVTLNGVTVTDPLPGLSALNCTKDQPAILQPGDSLTCTSTYTATQVDIDSGLVANTATAAGTPPTGSPVTGTGEATVVATPTVGLVLAKTSDVSSVDAAGDPIIYTMTATNTGNVTLTGVGITDPLPGLSALDCTPAQPTILAPGADLTCTATYTATQADIDSGTITNTASATGTPPTGAPITDTRDATVTAAPDAVLAVVKTADVASVTAAGDPVTYTMTATNTGNVTLTAVGVTDPLPGLSALDCTPAQATTLAPGQSLTCTANYAATQADIDSGLITNTATGAGTPPTGSDVTATGDVTITAPPVAGLRITKTADVPSVTAAGDPITYTLTASNTGNVTLAGVTVTDPMPGLSALDCIPAQPATLAPGADLTCTASYTTTQADIDSGLITNSASATGTPPAGSALTDTGDATVLASRAPALQLAKTADVSSVTAAGDPITYTLTASNTGNVTLTNVAITDPLPGLSALDCTPAQRSTLAPGATLTCTASYTTTQADIDNGLIANTATAIGQPPTGSAVTATGDAAVPAAHAPGLAVAKTAEAAGTSAGDAVGYTITATNTGNVTLTGVTLTDPLPGLSALDCTPAQPATLAPGESLACTASYTLTQADIDSGLIANTATGTGTSPAGTPITGTDGETVPLAPAPGIQLTKTPDTTTITTVGDPITYTMTATNTGNVTLTGVGITDPMPGLSALDCTPAQPATLAPGGSLTCTASYLATQADIDNGLITNTATTTGTPPTGDPATDTSETTITITPDAQVGLAKSSRVANFGETGDVIPYDLVATNIGNVTLTDVVVQDPLPGMSPIVCDRPAPVTLAPGDSLACTASYTVTQDDVDAGRVANIAKATGTPPGGPATPGGRGPDDVTAFDSDLVPGARVPGIVLAKTTDVATVSAAGDPVTYTLSATNTGNVTLTGVGITDPLPGLSALDCTPAQPATLAPGQDLTCTATYTTTQTDIDSGAITNTATATGQPPTGSPVTGDDSATITAAPAAGLSVVKTSDPTTVTTAGDPITYTLTATNTGNVTLTDVTITDPMPGLTPLDCTPAQPATLVPGQALTCTATYISTQDDLDSGVINNTSVGTGLPPVGDPVSETAEATLPVGMAPGLAVDKSASADSVAAGTSVTYTYVLTNPGNVALSGVQLTDDKCAPVQFTSGDSDGDLRLDVGERWVYSCTTALSETTTNIATATAQDPSGTAVTGSDQVSVSILQGAQVPQTGATWWTQAAWWLGLILVGLGAVLLILRRRRGQTG